MRVLEVVIPGIVLKSLNVSLANASRRARFRQASSARKQRSDVTMVLNTSARHLSKELPVEVTITRFSPGELDEHDNLPASAKHVADAIAKWFGHPDNDPGFIWRFDQKVDRNYAIGIRIVGEICGEWITCGCCGTRLLCRLDKAHLGPCSGKKGT